MFDWLTSWIGGGASAAAPQPGLSSPMVPPSIFGFDPNATAYFDPAQGRVIGTPGAAPPAPTPKPDVPYGGPEMPPMARGGSSAPPPDPKPVLPNITPGPMPAPAAGPRITPGPMPAPSGPQITPGPIPPQMTGSLLDYLRTQYKTGGTF
jgi:hypothetical protein